MVRLGWGNFALKQPSGGRNRRSGRRERHLPEQLNAHSEELNATMRHHGTELVAFTLTSDPALERTLCPLRKMPRLSWTSGMARSLSAPTGGASCPGEPPPAHPPMVHPASPPPSARPVSPCQSNVLDTVDKLLHLKCLFIIVVIPPVLQDEPALRIHRLQF